MVLESIHHPGGYGRQTHFPQVEVSSQSAGSISTACTPLPEAKYRSTGLVPAELEYRSTGSQGVHTMLIEPAILA